MRLETVPRPGEVARPARLLEAMRHAVLAGGKRLRPFLLSEVARLLDPSLTIDALMPAAAAIECLHCYSLVHDDLPAMDDDALRRGRPTVHVAYDEATAILAGDALLTLAFDLLADPACQHRSGDPRGPCARSRPCRWPWRHGRRPDAGSGGRRALWGRSATRRSRHSQATGDENRCAHPRRHGHGRPGLVAQTTTSCAASRASATFSASPSNSPTIFSTSPPPKARWARPSPRMRSTARGRW